MRGSMFVMRGSCAGKFDPRSGVFISPVVNVKTDRFTNIASPGARFSIVFHRFLKFSNDCSLFVYVPHRFFMIHVVYVSDVS